MIDLHIHSNHSDGTWSLKRILKKAKKLNLEVISITDHDTLDAYVELEKLKYKKTYSGNIITGIEISTGYDSTAFHMLAYDFDYKILKKYIDEKYKDKKLDLNKEFEYMMNNCRKNNIKTGEIEYKPEDGWPIDAIYAEIRKYPENKQYFTQEEWDDIDVFFISCFSNKDFPVYLDMSIHYPNAKEVAEEVRKAGGKTFIAHIYKYRLKEPIKFLDLLRDNKVIDGVEVEHSTFSEEQTKILKEYCKENKLLMSGGADSHGKKKAERKLGIGYGEMKISKELIKDWYKE